MMPTRSRSVATPGNLAFLAVLLSGEAHLAMAYAPRPWSALGHIDIAQLLAVTPIFHTHWPYWTFPFEYHPLIGWGSALISYLTSDLLALVVVWLLAMAFCARATAQLLAARIGARRTIVFWSLAPQLLLFSANNFDSFAVLTLVVAGASLARGRGVTAGIAIAAGAATKLFPLVGVPPHFIALWRAGRTGVAMRLAVATTVALVLIDLPAVIAPYSLLGTAVWPYGVATWNVDSIWLPVAMLLDPFLAPPAADRVITLVSLAGLAVSYVLLVLRPAFRGADAQRLAWLAVAVLVFWTRLRSSQYAIWLLPVFALYVPDVPLLLFMFVGDVTAFVAVFLLHGAPRDLLGPDALPFYAAIAFGVIVRQIAVMRLIVAASRPRGTSARAPEREADAFRE